MAKDVAFLFYPGDWLGGTLLMSRHHKGAYMDLLVAQFNNGHMALQEIKTLLGKEDENLWEEVLSKKFVQDSEGKYYNEKLDKEIFKRRGFTSSRTNNLKKNSDTSSHTAGHMDSHMGIGNGIGNGIEEEGGAGGNETNGFSAEVNQLYDSTVILFDERTRPHTAKQISDWHDTLDKCIRIDGYSADRVQEIVKRMRMDDFWRTNFMSIMKLRQTNKQGVKYIDFFDARLKGSTRPAFGIPMVQRDYTTPQTSFS